MWRFVNYISPELPDIKMDENELSRSIQQLQQEIHAMKISLEKN
jgi:hypothetical protein